jgi:hypothetical protein
MILQTGKGVQYMIRKWFAAVLGGATLALLALTACVQADDGACAGCAACAASGCKSCKESPTTQTIKVDHRCYSCKCDEISFPQSCILASLFHGWKRKYSCADGHCGGCDQGADSSPPPATCGHTYTRKVLIIKIQKEDKEINVCGGGSFGYGARPEISQGPLGESLQGSPPAMPAQPEPVPAPKPADAPKGEQGVMVTPTMWTRPH